jgi:hypothetical protein
VIIELFDYVTNEHIARVQSEGLPQKDQEIELDPSAPEWLFVIEIVWRMQEDTLKVGPATMVRPYQLTPHVYLRRQAKPTAPS